MYQRNRLQHGDNFPLNMTISFFTTRKHVLGVFLTLFFICIIYYRVIQFVLLFMHNGRHFDLLFFVTEMCGPNKYFSSLILDRIQHSQPIGSYYKCPCIARRSPKKSLFSDTVGYPLVPFLFYLNYNMPIYAKRWRVPFGTPPAGWGCGLCLGGGNEVFLIPPCLLWEWWKSLREWW